MTAHRSPLRARLRRAAALSVAGLAATVVLVACGDEDGSDAGHSAGHDRSESRSPSAEPTESGQSESEPGAEWNDADVAFAQGMIPHHRQAVEMAELAASRAESAEVVGLAEAIEAAQAPEIATLSEWLTGWGEDVPAEDEDHSGHDMAGMMSPDDMTALEQSSGAEFDAAFLRMMIEHHEGAVEMAETERANGAYQPALDMAGEIIATQSDEITRMNELIDAA
ncbi:DUF305 domain-containing protein [Streptomyces sp. 8K308]|uniref:DUF305 domain-containing protein n=1 Tax=Streptomyces sp. 8K308 TaxID=2530388 RepID=UPI00104FE98C|nr:DUF305 domain-containing protein [Streptomyces sp. 8K308]TDC23026.1 DUF305 domain-containing protein [Streptomyces sp. 8K308]